MKHIKRILCTALSLALIACLCAAPVSAADEGWKDAYRTVITNNVGSGGAVCQLADFNLDGIPELLIGSIPGSGLFSVIKHAYTFSNGSAVEISVPDKNLKLGDTYELHHNGETGEACVEGSYVMHGGYSTSANVTANYSFDGSVLSYVSTFVSSVELAKSKYTVGTKEVSAGEYNNAYNTRYVGWTKFEYSVPSLTVTQKPSSAEIDNLLNSYKYGAALSIPSSHKLKVNGTSVSAAAFGINGNNYFKLRDLAMLLNDTGATFSVEFDGAKNSISLTTGQPYTALGVELAAGPTVNQLGVTTPSSIYIDGQPVSLDGYNIGGNNYFKLRDLGELLGFEVGWDSSTRTMSITAD